jgi:hypothetical protein
MYQRVNYLLYIARHRPRKHQTIEQPLRCQLFDETQFQIRACYAVAVLRRGGFRRPVAID